MVIFRRRMSAIQAKRAEGAEFYDEVPPSFVGMIIASTYDGQLISETHMLTEGHTECILSFWGSFT
jgi:hypothetical protein